MQYHNWRTYNRVAIDLTIILEQILGLFCKLGPWFIHVYIMHTHNCHVVDCQFSCQHARQGACKWYSSVTVFS